MLRADRHEDQRCLCWEDSGQELAAEAPPEGEDVSGDLHPPQPETQALGWLSQLL